MPLPWRAVYISPLPTFEPEGVQSYSTQSYSHQYSLMFVSIRVHQYGIHYTNSVLISPSVHISVRSSYVMISELFIRVY